jgi:hypothetical protein
VGVTGYDPTSFHDLLSNDDLLMEGSSVGDAMSLSYPTLRECTMADVQGPQAVPMEIGDMHTPPDLRTQALANAQTHGEDLRQQRQHQLPPASIYP